MKRIGWLWIVAAVVIVGLGASSCQKSTPTTTPTAPKTSGLFLNNAYAATPDKPATAKKTPPALLTAKGEVTAVDAKKLTFTLKEEGKDVPTVFSCSAKIAKDLTVGQKVEVSYIKTAKGTYRAVKVQKVQETATQGTTPQGTTPKGTTPKK